jgi:hypothetical protein
MPKTALATSTIVKLNLSPEVGERLSALAGTYCELAEQVRILKQQMKDEAAKVFALMEDEGIEKCRVDGQPLCIVRGVSSSLDKMKFVELGGSLEMLKNATVSKPKKAYVKIGEGSDEY